MPTTRNGTSCGTRFYRVDMAITSPQMSFAGGVIHPLYVHRQSDVQLYPMGLRESVNGIVLGTGAWTRRPGTYFTAQTKSNKPGYLVRWEYNVSDIYVLEFTDLKLRFYREHALVLTSGVAYEIDTPFTEAELPYLQAFQKKETLWILSGVSGVHMLTRNNDTDWVLSEANAAKGPFLDENTNESLTMSVSAVGKPGTEVTVTASSDVFTEAHQGMLLRIDGAVAELKENLVCEGAGVSSNMVLLPINGEFRASAVGTNEVTFALQYSEDAVTWSTYWELVMPRDSRGAFEWVDGTWKYMAAKSGSNTMNKAVYLRLAVLSTDGSADAAAAIIFVRYAASHSGIIQLTSYVSATQMTGEIVTEPADTTPTYHWAFGAYGEISGYPRVLGFKDRRSVTGSTEDGPLTLNFSRIAENDNYADYTEGLEDDDAFTFTLDRARNRFNWIEGSWMDTLMIGSEKSVLELTPVSEGGFTPTNPPMVRRELIIPMSRIPPQMVDEVMLAVGGDRDRQLFQFFWSEERGGVVADDVTQFASHVSGEGFSGMAIQLGRQNLLWLPTSEGIAGCTYRPNLPAWHTHTFGDEVVSVCTSRNGDAEELWLCVRRGTDYFIEYLALLDIDLDIEDCHYMDCGVAWDGGEAVTLSTITLTSPTTLTLSEWPKDSNGVDLANGDYVKITGYADLADQVFMVADANSAAKTLTLKDQTGTTVIDASAFTTYTSGADLTWVSNSIAGMGHLDGETLIALCDGTEVDCTGAATIILGTEVTDFYNTIHVGVEVTATIESLPPEFYLQSGSTIGKTKQLSSLTLSLYKSKGGRYCVTGGKELDIPYRRTNAQTQAAPALWTGQLNLGPSGGVFDGEMTLTLVVDGCYPFTLRGMAPKVEVN